MICAVLWNVGRKGPRDGIVRLITDLQVQEDADIIALAECSDQVVATVLRALNPRGRSPAFNLIPTTSRVRLLVRGPVPGTHELDSHEYYSVVHLLPNVGPARILVVIHMVSLVSKDRGHIDHELTLLAGAIRKAEDSLQHSRTILLGDLNANPFADGVVNASGLHGVMSRAVAARGSRQASHRSYPFFFNPMWQFFGDGETQPAGSCYYEPEGAHTGYYWNLFDQVLIRPCLLPYYAHDSVKIVSLIAGKRLTQSNWIPDRSIGSDHLPVRLRLTR